MNLKDRALKFRRVKRISQDNSRDILFRVGEETVRIFPKPGRKLVSCSCGNHARFPVQQALCKHKLAALNFWMNEGNILYGWEETTEKETDDLDEKDFAVFTTDNKLKYFKRK